MQDPSARPGWTWRLAFAATALALWTPAIVGVALDHQLRDQWHDLWFWPALVPARYFSETFYDESFVWATVASLAILTAATHWRRWVGILGALLQGLVSLGYMKALLAM
ncbi:MAG: hypothetical protein ACJAZN_003446 [Planctomycetota bacterium]|jgi:hypothetical protein